MKESEIESYLRQKKILREATMKFRRRVMFLNESGRNDKEA